MERQGQVVTVKQGVQAVLGLGGEPHQNGAVGDERTLVADL
jgi:hypothetical protein